mgnify:CR=1 FL=1
MLEKTNFLIDYVGSGNFLTIIVFILSIIIGFYFYYKNFYRLVYSTNRICKTRNNITDWTNEETEFISRILFLNNGRKTITKDEIKNLSIKSSNKVSDVRIIKGVEKTLINKENNKINIEFEYIDSSDFLLLEINHFGLLTVDGRISETGEILHTETKTWIIVNVIFLIFFFANMMYNVYEYLKPETPNLKMFGLNLIILFALFQVLRYIHKLFFIPDSISFKYLDSKDKWNKEFRNEY